MVSQDDGSVTRWIDGLKAGDAEAAEALWGRYFERLVGLARAKLASARSKAVEDEEDAALSALVSLWDGAVDGRFEQLRDRDDLWRLLVVLTARKAQDQRRRQGRQKRGGGVAFVGLAGGDGSRDGTLMEVAGEEPSPEFAAMVAEEYARRIDELEDETLRQVASMRLEGYSNDEIAARLGCVTRTVERKLDLIRKVWSREREA
jgi:DNA-directed RNA polymerase specialized sigma24 family protein